MDVDRVGSRQGYQLVPKSAGFPHAGNCVEAQSAMRQPFLAENGN